MKKILLVALIGLFLCNNGMQANAFQCFKKNEGTKQMEVKQVRASHLLVSTKEEAEKIRQEILNGKSFAEAAKEYSQCPSGRDGGDLGFFGRGRMVPEFDQAAFALPVGQLSEPIQTQFGWHLLIVTEQK